MSRTSRLLELIGVLRSRRMPVTAVDLACELNVSQRSIYRDIDTLRSLGARIEGEAGIGFQLRDGFFLPHFAFSEDELEALVLGLSWVRERADAGLARSSESALAKILTARINGAAAAQQVPALVAAASRSRLADPPQAASLRGAIRRQRKVAIRYEDGAGKSSERTIWPIAIVYFDDVRVLAAWCELQSGFRHFRVDRMEVIGILEDRYPGRRQSLVAQWRQQDRDWRSLLTVSDTARG